MRTVRNSNSRAVYLQNVVSVYEVFERPISYRFIYWCCHLLVLFIVKLGIFLLDSFFSRVTIVLKEKRNEEDSKLGQMASLLNTTTTIAKQQQ